MYKIEIVLNWKNKKAMKYLDKLTKGIVDILNTVPGIKVSGFIVHNIKK